MDRDTFFRWVDGREGRYELVSGTVLKLTPVQRAHAQVTTRLLTMLVGQLAEDAFQVFQSGFGVKTFAGIRCPDIVVDHVGGEGGDRWGRGARVDLAAR
jgi:hypothetical protein